MYKQIRSQFLDFFKQKDHLILPSSGLIPHNDPSLMFTNSGMVQFKNVFLGLEKPQYKNVTTVQKSLRAGGKHNDLDNVGYTARHHTFFEMLGNFSFSEYFKEQAILQAWEFLTKEIGLPKEKLYVTVFYNDDEAFNIWKKVLGTEDRIIRIESNDNFWSMGDSGPCGPCSEIFYDYGDKVAGGKPGTPEQDGDRFVEIWNLVFMQYNQENGVKTPLKQTAIDTGMGLERLVSVLEGKTDNYDTSLFLSLRKGIAENYNCDAFGKENTACKVVADHVRAISFLIAEGVTPSNEGRGYVLRRIMRRAMRYLHQIDPENAKMHTIVDFLDSQMGEAYHELRRAVPTIKDVIATEEQNFKQMLDRGLKILNDNIDGAILGGETAFKLYDTYGFPLDLTQDILRAKNIAVDVDGFEKALEKQKEMSKAAWKGSGEVADDKIWFELKEKFGETPFLGYEKTVGKAKVLAIVGDWVVFDKTVFYPEGGGQIGDTGFIGKMSGQNDESLSIEEATKSWSSYEVVDTKKFADTIIAHKIKGNFDLCIGQQYDLQVGIFKRPETAKHHSATHLLQAALQRIVGSHVAQKGSKVEPHRLTFDFSHGKALTPEEIAKVENDVNEKISQQLDVSCQNMPKLEAEKLGAMALFGEKYGDEVRVVNMQDISVELCGGTHVKNTGFIGSFKIISESSVASGVRRIEAKCGQALTKYLEDQIAIKNQEIAASAEQKKQQAKEIEKLQIGFSIKNTKTDGDIIIIEEKFAPNIVREAVISVAKNNPHAIVIGVSINENGATYIVDIGSEGNKEKAIQMAQKMQQDVGVAQIKPFNGKILIFGGKLIKI